jgi:ubiquinol-cytochrome c reductase iron-sulfur subunit
MKRRSALGAAAALTGAVGAYFAAIPFVRSLLPSAKSQAQGGPIEIDLSALKPGEVRPYSYRGRTMLVLRRTPEMLGKLAAMTDRIIDSEPVADPDYATNESRSIRREYLVVEGVCTHLGCVPRLISAEDGREAVGEWWTGGFLCPCHNSGFDYAGRVVKGPAPSNLPVPPHRYLSATRLVIGEESVET